MNGVFNSNAHAAEIALLKSGKLKQFQIIPVPLDNAGIVKIGGGDQGCYDAEGCGIIVLNSFVDKDRQVRQSQVAAPIYVQFNHPDNPFLPIGIPDSTQQTVNPWPSAYALTIGSMWFYVPPGSVNAGKVIYILVLKAVSIACAGGYSSAGQIGTYAPPGSANTPTPPVAKYS